MVWRVRVGKRPEGVSMIKKVTAADPDVQNRN